MGGATGGAKLALAAAIALGVGGSATSAGAAKVLRIANQSDYDYYDGMSYYGDVWSFESLTCNALLDYPVSTAPDRSTPRPGVAVDTPTISPDGRTYTFTIRTGVRFANGRELTPQDVVGTYERMLDPAASFNPLSSGYYNGIEGFARYTGTDRNGRPLRSNAKHISGITVSGQQVRFRLARANPAFLYAVAMRWACIVPADSPHKHTTLPPPTTGPYLFSRVQPKVGFTMVRNPQWPTNVAAGMIQDPGAYALDEIDYSIQSPGTMLAALARGTLDLNVDGASLAGGAVKTLGASARRRVVSVADAATSYFTFGFRRGSPFRNVNLRRAINLAIDRKALIAIQDGPPVGTPWSQFLPASMLAAGAPRTVYPNRPDLRAARRLVRRSGMRTPIDANLYYQAGEPGDELARSVQRSAARIGIRLKLKGENTSVYYTDIQDPRAARDDMAFGAWGEDFDDASTYFEPLLSSAAAHGGSNYGDYSDPALDRAIARIERMPIGPERTRAFSDLSTSVMRSKAPIAAFRLRRRAFLLSPRVTGFSYRPETGIDLGHLDLR